jgi:shikimate dehydrogenase
MNINGNTKIYGVFGCPVRHTLSPIFQNAALKKSGLNAVYLPFEVEPGSLKKALLALPTLGISGVNVTVPHKKAALKLMDELSKEAKLIGAVNVVVIKNGKFFGYNTDGKGFINAVREEFGFLPRGKKVVVLGAGGAANAVAFQLAIEGACALTVANRTFSRAKELCLRLKKIFPNCRIKAISVADKNLSGFIRDADLLVNTASCGMKKDYPLLIAPSSLHSKLLVYDLIYNPPETKLLKAARMKGLKCANGLSMLIHQGAISFKLWTGIKAPLDTMRQSLKRFLGEQDKYI